MYLPQERQQNLPSDWLLLEVPSGTIGEAPETTYLSSRGARFETYETANDFTGTSTQTVKSPATLDVAETTLDGDTGKVRKPGMTLTSASYFDDWLHRGPFLFDMDFHTYIRFTARQTSSKTPQGFQCRPG